MNSKTYSTQPLLNIAKTLSKRHKSIDVGKSKLDIDQILSVARSGTVVSLTKDKTVRNKIQLCYEKMLNDIRQGVPVYGCNTSYGARASEVLINGSTEERLEMARQLSEGIAHVDVSVGPKFEKDVVRAAILIRVNMLMKGVSAVKIQDLEKYIKLLNYQITPIIGEYGGVGASGDLAHNAAVLSVLRQLPGSTVLDPEGNIRNAKKELLKNNISPLILDPKAGLGFVNGDNFSTAVASLLTVDTVNVLLLSFVLNALVIEVLRGTDRSFHPLLGKVRPHQGQVEVAEIFRYLLNGSKLAFQEMQGHQLREPGVKVQDGYSLRCISQYQGVNVEKIKRILDTIEINANSVSDNPLWVSPEYISKNEKPWQWVSGGNFIAMNMVDVLDDLRKILTQTTKLNDRHLARMVNPNENNGLPPNLSDKSAVTHCTFKGVQIQSGMFDVYSSLLSIPVSTFFGVHEEGNQDITSHALTSGILGMENLRITRYSIAQNLLAVAQAVDILGGSSKLSKKTRPLFEFVRSKVSYSKKEEPLKNKIELLYETISSGEINEVVIELFSSK